MELIAIISNLLRYFLALAALVFCVMLFRHYRKIGWLLVGAVFLEPVVQLALRAAQGWPLLPYKRIVPSTDNLLHVEYTWDFPILYLLAVVGLFLLVRKIRDEQKA
jgi:hypothetical protein